MKEFRGLPASPGISWGKAFVIRKKEEGEHFSQGEEEERRRLERAKEEVRKELESAKAKVGEEERGIFDAHLLLLEDPEIWERVERRIKEGLSAERAIDETLEDIAQVFLSLEDERFRSRVEDIRDIGNRLKEALRGGGNLPTEPVVLIGEEILPSLVADLDREIALGFVSSSGSPFSHAAILARAKGIPMVVSCQGITEEVKEGDLVLLDGKEGKVMINLEESILRKYGRRQRRGKHWEEEAFAKRHMPAITKSGRRIKVYANVGDTEEVREAKEMGAEGIGIFRTEFLLFGREEPPSKEEHLSIYRESARLFYPQPVHVRLFDIGADKAFPFLDLPPEANPALGLRGIRLLLQRRDLLLPQIEAVKETFREFPNIAIIVPMVSFQEEVKEIRRLAGEVPVGIMVETPASALLAGKLAEISDFLSLGTNDLLQYTLAVDRAGKDVGSLYDPKHPALWKIISMVVRAVRRKGKEVGVCGEIGGEEEFIPRLVRMGVGHLSVSPKFIPQVKEIIRERT